MVRHQLALGYGKDVRSLEDPLQALVDERLPETKEIFGLGDKTRGNVDHWVRRELETRTYLGGPWCKTGKINKIQLLIMS